MLVSGRLRLANIRPTPRIGPGDDRSARLDGSLPCDLHHFAIGWPVIAMPQGRRPPGGMVFTANDADRRCKWLPGICQ
jgi:hypothetical protein